MDAQQRRRLLKLADVLQNAKTEMPKTRFPGNGPIKKFDMGDWGSTDTDDRGRCKTAACALGTAACHPYFRKQGLIGTVDSWGNLRIEYSGELYTSAAAAFFGITNFEADELFVWTQNTTPKQVARSVRKLVAEYDEAANAN